MNFRGSSRPAGDQRPPVHHWMISSARTRMDCGMVRPMALAVFMLMTSSNFGRLGVTCAAEKEREPSRTRDRQGSGAPQCLSTPSATDRDLLGVYCLDSTGMP